MRDAIVIPGWSWNAFNAPERVALALAHLIVSRRRNHCIVKGKLWAGVRLGGR